MARLASGTQQGIFWAVLTALIWAAYPVVTRVSVTQSLDPADLFALRFGISALLFAPYLVLRAAALPRNAWLHGVGLALCQGTLAGLVIAGLQFAPASHASALVQGIIPAWMLVGVLAAGQTFHRRSKRGLLLVSAGALALVASAAATADSRAVHADLMFLLASLLGAGYVLQTRRYGLPATAAAAFVAVYSAIGFLPWYVASRSDLVGHLARVPAFEIGLQALYQGVLVGVVSFIALNRAIASLGSMKVSAFISGVPILTAILGVPILGEAPSPTEYGALALITLGAFLVGRSDPGAASTRSPPSSLAHHRPGDAEVDPNNARASPA